MKLRAQGHVYEADGAVWLRTTDFDDDKDRVLVKADGELTYFASDTAYYVDKRDRGYDVNIYLLGADHHGYVNRLRAVAACAGDDPDYNIEVLIGQMVKMMRGGEEVRLSKRAGNIVTLEDLVEEVGVDAARYTLIRYPADSPLTLDLDLLVSGPTTTRSSTCSTRTRGSARCCATPPTSGSTGAQRTSTRRCSRTNGSPRCWASSASCPGWSPSAAELREPHRVARYLEDLATAYHKFYDVCRVLPRGDEDRWSRSTSRGCGCAPRRGRPSPTAWTCCGVEAPERM